MLLAVLGFRLLFVFQHFQLEVGIVEVLCGTARSSAAGAGARAGAGAGMGAGAGTVRTAAARA